MGGMDWPILITHSGTLTLSHSVTERRLKSRPLPVIIRKGKLEVALFNTIPLPIENWPRAEGKPDICRASVKRLAAAIRKYKASHPSARIVAVLHWGTEFQPIPDMQQRYDAHLLVQAGADAIIGHHPHVVQPLNTSIPDPYSTASVISYSTKATLTAGKPQWLSCASRLPKCRHGPFL